jgi:chloride channel protein, CIC family
MPSPSRPRLRLKTLREWIRTADFAVARRFGIASREDRLFYLAIGIVGVVSGALGMLTERLIAALQALLWSRGNPLPAAWAALFYGTHKDLLQLARAAPRWEVVAAPAVGGALLGLFLWRSRRPAAGEGMASLIEAVALHGGKIPPKPVILNALTSIITVGSGGSLGREGPMIRLGAMISSWAGQRFGLPPHRVKILVGCGAAAGLAATYNIPIGGALFAMEVILGNFALEIFGPIVASSVIATVISRSLNGNAPLYAAPGYTLLSGWELLFHAGLGIVGAFASVAFVLGIRAGHRAFAALSFMPRPLHPLLGMTLVGVLGLYVPYALGRGYSTINLALAGTLKLPPHLALPHEFTILLLLGLAVAKLAATALTTGGGGSGGMFTPSLLFGALVGGAYGYWVHSLWPHVASPYGAYAAVGMAAVMAGTSQAPISAILILFEFTGNYDLILPVMLAAIISSLLSRQLRPYSIYTEPLQRKGIDLTWRMEEAVLAGLKAEDLARPDLDVLHPGDRYHAVVDKFFATRRQRLFVVDAAGTLLGAVSLHDIQGALEQPETLAAVVAYDLMSPVEEAVHKGERLHRATELFAQTDRERLPVVDEAGKLLGLLAKRDLLAVYAQEVLGRPALLATYAASQEPGGSRHYMEIPPDFALRQIALPPSLAGKTLAEARLPQTFGARVLEIRRPARAGEETVLPTADTRLESGDLLTLLAPTATLDALSAGKVEHDEAVAHLGLD